MTVIARLTGVVRPEALAPAPGTIVEEADLDSAFGLEAIAAHTGRYQGHLFIFLDKQGQLANPESVRLPVEGARDGETAFVLTRSAPSRWRYAGVGRRTGSDTWSIPEVDYATWSSLGEGRRVSRELPSQFAESAKAVVDEVLASGRREFLRTDGQRARIVGRASQGGLLIDGGEGGFKERTISLKDLGWALAARADVASHGGLLDEHRVNRLRYLEGTPQGSTRWIDSGWALGLVASTPRS